MLICAGLRQGALYETFTSRSNVMLDEPAHKTVIIGFLDFACSLLFLFELFTQFNQFGGLFYSETLIQEGVDKQVHVIFLHMQCPPSLFQSERPPLTLRTILYII